MEARNTPRGAIVTGHGRGAGVTPLAAPRHHGALPGEQGTGCRHRGTPLAALRARVACRAGVEA